MNNNELISKAAVDTSVLVNGGKMNAEQQKEFITFMRDYSVFLNRVNFIRMASTTRDIDSLEVNDDAMRRQVENADNPATGEAAHERRTLHAIGVIMGYNISFQYMKENIEGPGANTTLARLFAQEFTNASVKLGFLGDETSSHPFYSINDGWLKIAEDDVKSHKYDTAGSVDYLSKIFPDILAMMPSKYFQMYQQEDKNLLKIFCGYDVSRAYKHQLQERNTALGDSVILQGQNVTYDGFEIYPVGFMPEKTIMLTSFENLVYGIYGQSLETFHDVVARKTRHEYTLLADFDMEIVNPDVLVMAKDRT